MNNKVLHYILALVSLVYGQDLVAQDLLTLLDKEPIVQPEFTLSTFKGNRLSLGHSVETRKKGALEFTFMSRYWNTTQENSNSFIADRVSTRLGADYAITDRFTTGVGFGLSNGIVDGYAKYRILRQGINNNGSPIGITGLQTATYRSESFNNIEERDDFFQKTAFTTQLLIARKITQDFSLQLSPTFVYRSSSRNINDDNTQFAVGFGGRYKVAHHVSIVSEYYYVANELESIETFGAFALGVNWSVRHILLQFSMTNNPTFTEDSFITQTRKNFNFRDGNFFFGFNATYFLQL